jgi:hypothetical protein
MWEDTRMIVLVAVLLLVFLFMRLVLGMGVIMPGRI